MFLREMYVYWRRPLGYVHLGEAEVELVKGQELVFGEHGKVVAVLVGMGTRLISSLCAWDTVCTINGRLFFLSPSST